MMIERHYEDEALIALLETNRVRSDAHLPSCPGCSDKLESFRTISGALRRRSVWDTRPLQEEPVRATIATLRAFADRMADDDTRAEVWLRDLIDGPRESWAAKLSQHPEYRTAGMVRRLIAATDRAIDTMPPDAVELTALATDIADHLDPAIHPSDTIPRLRGAAWRERAFALYYTGQYAGAEKAVRLADAHFSVCVVDEYDRARVGVVQALIARGQDRLDSAMAGSRASGEMFARYGDLIRYISAGSSEANVLVHSGRTAEALKLYVELEKNFHRDDATDSRARLLSNIAYTYAALGKTEEALAHYQDAGDVFEVLGNATESARIRWNVAVLLLENGRHADADTRLVIALRDFESLKMYGLAAMAALDLAEVRLLNGRHSDVIELCASASRYFTDAGVGDTARASRAIAYVREAAAAGKATPQLVKHVRDYVRRLPTEPTLLFLPIPD